MGVSRGGYGVEPSYGYGQRLGRGGVPPFGRQPGLGGRGGAYEPFARQGPAYGGRMRGAFRGGW